MSYLDQLSGGSQHDYRALPPHKRLLITPVQVADLSHTGLSVALAGGGAATADAAFVDPTGSVRGTLRNTIRNLPGEIRRDYRAGLKQRQAQEQVRRRQRARQQRRQRRQRCYDDGGGGGGGGGGEYRGFARPPSLESISPSELNDMIDREDNEIVPAREQRAEELEQHQLEPELRE
jgi:hypothetical protein